MQVLFKHKAQKSLKELVRLKSAKCYWLPSSFQVSPHEAQANTRNKTTTRKRLNSPSNPSTKQQNTAINIRATDLLCSAWKCHVTINIRDLTAQIWLGSSRCFLGRVYRWGVLALASGFPSRFNPSTHFPCKHELTSVLFRNETQSGIM